MNCVLSFDDYLIFIHNMDVLCFSWSLFHFVTFHHFVTLHRIKISFGVLALNVTFRFVSFIFLILALFWSLFFIAFGFFRRCRHWSHLIEMRVSQQLPTCLKQLEYWCQHDLSWNVFLKSLDCFSLKSNRRLTGIPNMVRPPINLWFLRLDPENQGRHPAIPFFFSLLHF